jgi:hypothetical protein
MNAQGQFTFIDGALAYNEVSRTVAALVGLRELDNLVFQTASGSINISHGKALINSRITGADLKIHSQGTISLAAGALNLPVTLRLSPALSDKLSQRLSIAKYLTNEEGETALRLNIGGTLQKPRPALDQTTLKEQAGRAIEKKLFQELNKTLGGREQQPPAEREPAKDLIRGIFGL